MKFEISKAEIENTNIEPAERPKLTKLRETRAIKEYVKIANRCLPAKLCEEDDGTILYEMKCMTEGS